MPTKKIFSKKLSNRIPILLWLLPAILLLILFAFSTYYRTDKFNTEYSNTSDKCMAYQKLYNKMLFGCSYPIIKYGAANDACYDTLETDPKTNRKITYYGYLVKWPIAVFIISRTIGQRYWVRSSSSSGVRSVFPLRIKPIFRWSMDKYGYLYFSSILCARTVFPVCDAPVISIIIFTPKDGIVSIGLHIPFVLPLSI